MFDRKPIEEVIKSLERRSVKIKKVTKIFKKFCINESNYIVLNNTIYKQREGLTL